MKQEQFNGKLPAKGNMDEQSNTHQPPTGSNDPIVNEEEQNQPINPQDDKEIEDGEKAYREGIKNDSDNGEEDDLPGQDDDSGKTIRETPKMRR